MKVAMILTDEREEFHQYEKTLPYFGPAPTALLEGLTSLPKIELHIISCTKRQMSAPAKLADNIWFHLLHVNQRGWLRSLYCGCVLAIRAKLREIQPHIVHGQGTERYCALAAALSGFPNVITIHGNMRAIAEVTSARMFSYLWLAAKLEQFVLPRTLGVFCNSTYTESVVKSYARQTWRVANAVRREFFDTPLPSRSATAKPILLNIGTISPYKRQLELLALGKKLHQEGFSFEFQFIGAVASSSNYGAAFRRSVTGASDFAHKFGHTSLSDLIASMDTAAALVHVPAEEAFGLVVAEALARNLKFFGTDIGGIPDVAQGVDGAELFSLEDETSLCTAIVKWLQQGCPRPISAALEMKDRYHPKRIADRHVEIYEELLGKCSH